MFGVLARVRPDVRPAVDVRVEGDVGDRVVVAGHERRAARREAALERDERVAAAVEPVLEDLGRLRVAAGQPQEARHAELRLDPVLLEEHPLVHARPRRRRAAGRKACPRQGGAGSRPTPRSAPRVELEHRHAPVRVAREVLVGARLAREQVDGHELERQPELAQQDARLEAVSGGGMVVEDHGAANATLAAARWTTVVILCGGRGTRLREHTQTIPKPLVEIGGRPILWHVIRIYAEQGYRRFVLCTGHRGELIQEFVAANGLPGGLEIECVDTGEDTPRAGASRWSASASGSAASAPPTRTAWPTST